MKLPLRAPDRRRAAAFTIVEVVFAMGILLIGMTVILSLLTFGAALGRTASLRTAASTAAEAVMADLEESLFQVDEETGGAKEPPAELERRLPGFEAIQYKATTTVNPNDPLQYLVKVEMSWSTGGVRRSREFTTLMLREVPFGERLRRELIESEAAERERDVPWAAEKLRQAAQSEPQRRER